MGKSPTRCAPRSESHSFLFFLLWKMAGEMRTAFKVFLFHIFFGIYFFVVGKMLRKCALRSKSLSLSLACSLALSLALSLSRARARAPSPSLSINTIDRFRIFQNEQSYALCKIYHAHVYCPYCCIIAIIVAFCDHYHCIFFVYQYLRMCV